MYESVVSSVARVALCRDCWEMMLSGMGARVRSLLSQMEVVFAMALPRP